VSIGEALAEARRQAGLSVADVSRRTRIREGIIRGIEQDDYSECGGDFYARGHIRSIAKAAGADPGPLIREYDRVWRQPDAITDVLDLITASRAAPPAEPGGTPPRRRRNWAAVLAVAVVVAFGVVGYQLLAGSGHPAPARAAGDTAVTHPPSEHGSGTPVPRPSRRASASPGSAGATPPPAATPSPPAAATRTLTPASATAFGSSGAGQGDNSQLAPLAIDGSPGSAWHTDWYTSASFGNLYPGTGLLLDMGHQVTVTAAQITLGSAPGATFQLRIGSAAVLSALRPVAHAAAASGVMHLRLASPAHGRYLLIWFTQLPDDGGTFRASVHDVRLTVQA
jgi:cytoskeletal protein RodZ